MAVAIAASVGEGGANRPADVIVVQVLLNGVQPEAGGPTKRLAVDGKVGPLTTGAVRRFQLRQFGASLADGRVDASGPTLVRLNELAGASPFGSSEIRCDASPSSPHSRAVAAGAVTRSHWSRLLAMAPHAGGATPTAPGPLAAAIEVLPSAVTWTLFATGKLENVRLFLSREKQDTLDPIARGIFDSLNTHFHLDFQFPIPDKSALLRNRERIGLLITKFRRIWTVLGRSSDFFVEALTDTTAFARAELGGLDTGGKIKFCPPYLTLGPKFRTAVIVHESAHFIDASILHFASELPAPNGSPVDSAKNYAQLNFDEAKRNAYSYAQFAIHSFENFDHRLNFPAD